MKHFSLLLIVAALFSACNEQPMPGPTPGPEPTVTASPEPTLSPEPSPTVSPSPSPTPTTSPEPTPTTSPSPTPTTSPSPTPTVAPTDAPFIGDKAAFQKYLNNFVSDGAVHGDSFNTSKLTIKFGDLSSYGSYVIGLCQTGYNQGPIVTLKKSWWDSVSETQKRLLMHHELGHCVLYRGHRSSTFADGKPHSIMYPSIMGSSTFLGAEAYYLEELFTWILADPEDQTHVCGE